MAVRDNLSRSKDDKTYLFKMGLYPHSELCDGMTFKASNSVATLTDNEDGSKKVYLYNQQASIYSIIGLNKTNTIDLSQYKMLCVRVYAPRNSISPNYALYPKLSYVRTVEYDSYNNDYRYINNVNFDTRTGSGGGYLYPNYGEVITSMSLECLTTKIGGTLALRFIGGCECNIKEIWLE